MKDVNEMDDRGRTLLYCAARAGKMPYVEKALAGKANVNHCNKVGKHSLYAAARGGKADIVELLAAKGAEVGGVGGGSIRTVYSHTSDDVFSGRKRRLTEAHDTCL